MTTLAPKTWTGSASCATQTFALAHVAEQLRAEAAYDREGHGARTLVRAADLRVVLVVLRAGGELAKHQARATASLQVLSGQLHLQLPEQVMELEAGDLLALAPGLLHDVHARCDSAFLLTLGWSSSEDGGRQREDRAAG